MRTTATDRVRIAVTQADTLSTAIILVVSDDPLMSELVGTPRSRCPTRGAIR